jgi:hypothetical protein
MNKCNHQIVPGTNRVFKLNWGAYNQAFNVFFYSIHNNFIEKVMLSMLFMLGNYLRK